MQNPPRPTHHAFLPLQSNDSTPNWTIPNRFSTSGRGAMDIGGLLSGNSRQTANDSLRHSMHQNFLDNHYALTRNADSSVHSYGMDHSTSFSHLHQPRIIPNQAQSPKMDAASPKMKTEPAAKNFKCSTCPKKFARKSDLARHERIHTGHKPHICDYLGCGKKFIQRSALTVHTRVHTGEKPHHCEECNKPFSDSSSLARHRRIHLGVKPYKCPYINCQKTFTRRTTMTRHRNGCGGTIAPAMADTQMKTSHSVNDSFSDTQSSRASTASPRQSTSMSSNNEILQIPIFKPRQSADFSYLPHSQPFLPQLHPEYVQSRLDPPSIQTMTNFANLPPHRPRAIIPSSFGPPQPLEPPTRGITSGHDSSHPSILGWDHGGLPTSNTMDFMNIYPDPNFGTGSMFYGTRQPQTTGLDDWSLRSNHLSSSHFNTHLQFSQDWSDRPLNREIKPERAFAA